MTTRKRLRSNTIYLTVVFQEDTTATVAEDAMGM